MLVSRVAGHLILPFGACPDHPALYLGRWRGEPCRLVDLGDALEMPDSLESYGLLEEKPQLSIELLTLGGMGRMILHWQQRNRFCGYCGQPTRWLAEEWGRSCESCQSHMFPAIHPCAIVLVTRPGEVLLTRKPNWAANRYSLVAGFQEVGESLEETAVREVAEETGIKAGIVRYVGSQCWPFPSQVMVGFVAEYIDGDICVDQRELADARWFPVTDLPGLPPKRSIARYILDHILELP
jgi:NAD+ diphosphatase